MSGGSPQSSPSAVVPSLPRGLTADVLRHHVGMMIAISIDMNVYLIISMTRETSRDSADASACHLDSFNVRNGS